MAELLNQYNEDSIKSLDWREHIRLRPGMYIGKLGDGTSSDDGIYVLVKEIVDNSIDEHVMGNGKRIDINIDEKNFVTLTFVRPIELRQIVQIKNENIKLFTDIINKYIL